jgi:hypothetical protein
MRTLTLIAIVVCLCGSAHGADRIVMEWDFAKASDNLGWIPADHVDLFRVENGVFVTAPGPGSPKMESPLFDLQATPWQYVEIEMQSDSDGTGYLYYSNTSDEPYHGFRSDQYVTFEAVRGDSFRTYVVYPYWQKQGKITHIRLDPPQNHVRIRAIRIVAAAPAKPQTATSWTFKDSRQDWSARQVEVSTAKSSVELQGSSSSVFISPPIDVSANDSLCATIRLASDAERTVLFRWVSDNVQGLQSTPVRVRGDGQVHSYPLELSKMSGWKGRILAVGITPTDSTDPEKIKLESVALDSRPVGPPEIRMTRLHADKPFIRVGDKIRLVVEALNEGGRPAKELAGNLTLPSGTGAKTLPTKRVALLEPGQTQRFEWEVTAQTEGTLTAVSRVSAVGLDGDEKLIRLPVYPKLDKSIKADKQIPAPVPANTGDYLVGSYYFPGWNTYSRWAVLNDFPERHPVLGYYREGDPEVADWHVKWALDHGISFFIYDWYWDRGQRQLEHALHDGLFKSKFGDKMKFCLLWANHNPDDTASAEDLEKITQYWIDNYFKRPNYLKINGKNVMVIFSTYRLTKDMGSDAVKSSFIKMRKMCEDAGVGGLYIVGCTYPGPDRVKTLLAEGYDAMTGYNYPAAGNKGQRVAPYEWMVEGYKEWWGQIADASSLPYIPVCEPGWDSRPWHGMNNLVRTGKSPVLWQKMLENAKDYVDDPNRKKPEGKKLVFLEAWNEFGEGDYIEPHAEFGFDYLEAVREVFAPKSKPPLIVTPPDVGLGPYALTDPGVKTHWDFSKPEDRNWTAGNMNDVSYSSGVLSAVAANTDPIFYAPPTVVDASKHKIIEVRMKMDKGDFGEVFFADRFENMDQEKSVKFDVTADGEFHVYQVNMAQNPYWRGKVTAIRIDPNGIEGSKVEVACIKLR